MFTENEERYEPKWMDPKQLHALRGFSTSRQAVLRAEERIPFHYKGRYIRYLTSEIDDWILSHKV